MTDEEKLAEHVRVVREGHGANCSSIGSVIDTLFVAQVAAGAIFVAVAAALAKSESETETATKTESASETETEDP
ncbi:MAG TPA: hypothetical protein VGH28_28625 [Polyangiaceae bacterium]|jgi:hypothetical protein